MFHHATIRASEHPSLAAGEAWPGLLSPCEETVLASLDFPARRRKWLLGRAAAKRLVGAMLGSPAIPAAAITIRNRPSGEPYVVLEGRGVWPVPISISHRGEIGFAAAPATPDWRIGADVETVEPRDRALVRQFFTDEEARLVADAGGDGDAILARVWSAKEAVLKLLGLGLRLDTRGISVRWRDEPSPDRVEDWRSLEVTIVAAVPGQAPLRELRVVGRREGACVLTVALGR